MTIDELEKRVERLENLLHASIKMSGIKENYAQADTSALRETNSTQAIELNNHQDSIEQNIADIDYIKIMEDL